MLLVRRKRGKIPGRSRPGDNALRDFSGGSPQKESVKNRKKLNWENNFN